MISSKAGRGGFNLTFEELDLRCFVNESRPLDGLEMEESDAGVGSGFESV